MAKGRFTVEAVLKARDRLTRPIARMSSKFGRFARKAERAMAPVNRMVGQIGRGLRKVGIAAGIAGAAVAGVASKVIGVGSEFEQAITDVGAVGLKTRDQIAALEEKAKQLGATTKFSATEAARGMELMAKAGFSTEDILSGIDGVLNAAAASGLELAEVSGHVSNVLKGMGLETSEATRVADVLALASSRTNSSIGSLGESMKNVAATARQLGVPLEDAVAGVAALQDVGLDASVAGSAMNTMLTKLAKPSGQIARKMKEMGVTFKDAEGNMLPFQEVLANISKGAKNAGGNMDQVAFLADLVGLRGQKAAANLSKLFETGKIGDLTSELNKAEGSAKKMAALRMDTFKGDMLILEASVSALKTALFDTQSGPLRGIVQGFTAWVDKNRELITQNVKGFIEGLTEVLPVALDLIKRVALFAVPLLVVALGVKLVAAAHAGIAAMVALKVAILANPIGALVVAIAAAVGLIIAFWPEISAFFANLWEGIKDVAARIGDAVGGFIEQVWGPVKDFLIAAGEFVVGLVMLWIRPMLPILRPVFDAIAAAAGFIMEKWGPIKEFFADLWEGVKFAFSAAWDGIVSVAGTVFEKLKAVWEPIRDFFAGLWDGIVAHFERVFGGIIGAVSGVVNFVRGEGREALDGDEGTAPTPQVVSPEERLARTVSETTNTTRGEVTIRDESGRAEVTRAPRAGIVGLQLERSGTF
ncbi:MAG: phage tail tape measure protein [Myxococcota bacterium]